MAVMTTHGSEGALEKTSPVPSSEMMALDLEINGASKHEGHLESTDASLDSNLNLETSSATTLDPVTNGTSNVESFTANQTIDASRANASDEAQATSVGDGDILTDILNNVAPATDSLGDGTLNDDLFDAAPDMSIDESALETAVDDTTMASTVPLKVDAPESDVRHAVPESFPGDNALPATTDLVSNVQSSDSTQEQQLKVEDVSSQNEPATTQQTSSPDPPPFSDDASPMAVSDIKREQDNSVKESEQPPSLAPEASMESNHLEDTEMTTELPSTKVAREREDDSEIQPSAKRAKTAEDDSMDIDTSEQNGEQAAVPEASGLTDYASKEIVKIIKGEMRKKAGRSFKIPVGEAFPQLAESYALKVPNPIDLTTMQKKLENNEYPSRKAIQDDCHLLYSNSVLFNGLEHAVTKQGMSTRDSLLHQIALVGSEPVAAPKNNKKGTKKAVADRPAQRQARVANHVSQTPSQAPKAESPYAGTAVSTSPAFALDPETRSPVIRRDSILDRPKREVHPPKNKDITYPTSTRPKNKKFATELRFCDEVLNELKKGKYQHFNTVFMTPVDPVALNIPNYFTVIKNPMDLSKVTQKLKTGQYTRAKEFESDVRLIVSNCLKFNPNGNPVRVMANQFNDLFESQWARKDQYLADHTTAATPSVHDDSSEESEEEEEVAVPLPESIASQRLIEEQARLIELIQSKKADPNTIQMQQDMVAFLQAKLASQASVSKKSSKNAKAAKSRKAAPPKKNTKQTSSKKGGARNRPMNHFQKEVISAGIGQMPEEATTMVVAMIKAENPSINDESGEMELDIESVSEPTLWKIYDLVTKHAPHVEEGMQRSLVENQQTSPPEPVRSAKPKKNKPMSKQEQERKIAALRQSVQQFERQASGSQEPLMETVEPADESSGDESDSEEE